MASCRYLFWDDDRELHAQFLCAENRRVIVERIFLQFGWLAGDDSVPGGACRDDSRRAKLGPADGAAVSRSSLSAGGRNRFFVVDKDSFALRYGRALDAADDWLLQLAQPLLDVPWRLVNGSVYRQRNRSHRCACGCGWHPGAFSREYHQARDG